MTIQRSDSSQAGFSLLELLVAFAILATAATSLFLLGSTTAMGNTRSKEHAAASALAVDKIEQLRNTPFEEIVPDSDPGTISAGGELSASGSFTRAWTVSDTTVSGVPAKNVTVTVSGTPGVTVALTTTIIDPPKLLSAPEFPTVAVRSWSQR